MKDITHILPFYQDIRRIKVLVILFVLLLITVLIVDLNKNPYPPKVSFIDNSQFIKGELYIGDEYVGTMKDIVFSNLPDDFCEKPRTLSIDTEEESFSWNLNPQHCKTNYLKLEVTRKAKPSQPSQTPQQTAPEES